MNGPLNVLMIDETSGDTQKVQDILAAVAEVTLLGPCSSEGEVWLKLAQASVDVVILAVERYTRRHTLLLRSIRQQYPDIEMIIITETSEEITEFIEERQGLGVIETISKPAGPMSELVAEMFRQQLAGLIDTCRMKKKRALDILVSPSDVECLMMPVVSKGPSDRLFDVVAIGISTGGPNALHAVIPNLPKDLGVPILVVQHMPAAFTVSLAEGLNNRSSLYVKEAENGEPVLPDTVYIAPGGRHMAVYREKENLKIRIHDESPVNSCRPSADVLFRSLADVCGKRVLAIIMTGMGKDGALGVKAIKEQGGYCLSQSEQSCVVYGMPRAVDEMNLSDERVALDTFSERILALVQRSGRGQQP